MKSSFRYGFLVFSVFLFGCASVTERRRHQYVLVQSDPPGAEIISSGRVVGATPGLVYLRRDKQASVNLKLGQESQTVKLDTKYRWSEAFWGNFWLLSMAPVGWIVDYFSGSAWTYKDPETVKFKGQGPGKLTPPVMLLAPPLAETSAMSDEAAIYWDKRLREIYPKVKLLPYKETLSTFQEAGYEYDDRPSDLQREREVLYKSKANQIFLSEVKGRDQQYDLQGQRRNLEGQDLDRRTSDVTVSPGNYWEGSWAERIEDVVQIIPNTIGIELSNTSTSLSDGQQDYRSSETGDRNFWTDTLTYLQALTITRQQPPRLDGVGRWKFLFTPAGTLSYKKIFFPEFDKLTMVDFQYLNFGLGLGPEGGWQSGKHYYYARLIPLWTFSQIEWDQPGGSSEKMAAGSIDLQFEFGYLYFLNDHISLRLFGKSSSTNTSLWNSVAQKINPTTPNLESVSNSYVGVSLGYTFTTRPRLLSK